MNILFVVWNTHLGGTEGWILRNATALMTRGHQVYIWSIYGRGRLPEDAKISGIKLLPPLYSWPSLIFKMLNIIKAIYKFKKPLIIHSFGLKCDILVKIFFSGDPNIHIISGIRSIDPWRTWMHHILEKFRINKIDKWISNTKIGKTIYMERYKVKEERIKVIYNDVNIPLVQKDRTLFSMPKIVFLGNIQERKGIYELLKAIQIVKKEDMQFILHLYGNDFTNKNFLKLILDLDIQDRIAYHGFEFDKERIFKNAFFLVAPSYWEGFSNSIIEALSFGVPVIGTDVGGTPEIIKDRWNGLLVRAKDSQGLAKAMKDLLLHPEVAMQYGVNGRKSVEQLCNQNKLVNELISTYEKVIYF